jgi:hypothetical protein
MSSYHPHVSPAHVRLGHRSEWTRSPVMIESERKRSWSSGCHRLELTLGALRSLLDRELICFAIVRLEKVEKIETVWTWMMEENLLLEVGHGGRHLYMMVLSKKALNHLGYENPHETISSRVRYQNFPARETHTPMVRLARNLH